MTKTAKYLSLTACALAASLFLSGCGGGDAASAPPTVEITSEASGSTVTFTFTFSKALGTGIGDDLTKEEITVEGGTAGTFEVVDSTHATLIVTATAPTVSVSIAAAKFADVSHNFNSEVATGSYVAPVVDFAGTVGFDAFEGLISADVADDPVAGASNQVAKLVKGPSGQLWAGATIYTSGSKATPIISEADLGTNKIVTIRSYTSAPIGTVITLKFENAADGGKNVAAQTVTSVRNAWETLTFNFTSSDTGVSTGQVESGTVYNKASIFPAFSINGSPANSALGADTSFYFDNLKYTKTNLPTTAPTTPIDRSAETVRSIYSEAYTQIAADVDMNPGWSQATVNTEETIAGNKVRKLANFNYQGFDWTGNPQDITGFTGLHVDFWSKDATSVDVYLIDANGEQSRSVSLVPSAWTGANIPLSEFTTTDLSTIKQIKVVGHPSGKTVYMDNLYFYKIVVPTTAPTTPPTRSADNVRSIYSEAYTQIAADVNLNPPWGQATVNTEETIAGNKVRKLANLNYQGFDWAATPQNVSSFTKLHVDLWSSDSMTVNVSLIGGGEQAKTVTLTANAWTSTDISLSDYPSVDKTAVIQIKVDGTPSGKTVYLDNLYFWK